MKEINWEKSWKDHLQQYTKTIPRTGIFILHKLKRISTCLEIACGSARDSIYLANNNIKTTALDNEETLIKFLKEEFAKQKNINFIKANAFKLPFKKNEFDLIFHNGLFIYFGKNDIIKMLREQERVAKKYIFFFVHNKNNKTLVKKFKTKSNKDKLYNIYFFSKDDIYNIILKSGIIYKSIKIFKFGSINDVFYQKKIKKIPNIFYPLRNKIVPFLYNFSAQKRTERIACLIEF